MSSERVLCLTKQQCLLETLSPIGILLIEKSLLQAVMRSRQVAFRQDTLASTALFIVLVTELDAMCFEFLMVHGVLVMSFVSFLCNNHNELNQTVLH